jgi:hypothetical protein
LLDAAKLCALTIGLAALDVGCGSTPQGSNPLSGAGGAGGQGGQPSGAAGQAQDAGASGSGGMAGGDAVPDAGAAGTGQNGPAGSGGQVDAGVDAAPVVPAKNYQLSGAWPALKAAIDTKPGQLTYKKLVIHSDFLAESCAIGDYDKDGIPDVSSGRFWYQGTNDPATAFKVAHAFRSGHGALPNLGNGPEIDTGVSDDWSDFAFDMDGDGWTDIINVAQPEVNEVEKTNPKFGIVQPRASAYWYKNPGAALSGDPLWTGTQMHGDVRLEHHLVADMNGDGYPEVLGACRDCTPAKTKGFYQGDPSAPTKPWTFRSVTVEYLFPFYGSGWLKGIGANDINGDGRPDLLERSGAWLQQPDGTWNQTACVGPNTPAGCGWIKTNFYDGLPDLNGNKGPSHMFAVDMDRDGKTDVVAADFAYGIGLYWYRQTDEQTFVKYQFMGDNQAASVLKWGAGFTAPVALQVVDMDHDGRPDVVTGKMRFPLPRGYGIPDADGTPYIYVFKNVAQTDPNSGGPITLKPIKVDGDPTATVGTPAGGMGVGRQIGIGHANTDGIIDLCVATKVGLAVFLGQ